MPWLMEEGFTLKTPLTDDYIKDNASQFDEISLLHLNEAIESPEALVKEEIHQALTSLNRYPDIKRGPLSRAVEKNTGVDIKCQAWGAGASDLLYRAFNAVSCVGKNAVAPTPTFWGYERIYNLTRVDIRRVELAADYQIHAQDVLAAMDENTGLVSVVTPGTPTGISMAESDLIELAQKIPADVLFLIDEVYFEFAQNELDIIALLRQHRQGHWAVLRSFSKAYALASARIGYALCSSEDVAHRLIESGLNFPVAGLSFSAAYSVYTDEHFAKNMIRTISERREWLYQQLQALGLEPLPSDTNFVSVSLPIPATQSLPALKEAGILCSAWNHPNYPNHIRITVGSEQDNQQLVDTVAALLKTT